MHSMAVRVYPGSGGSSKQDDPLCDTGSSLRLQSIHDPIHSMGWGLAQEVHLAMMHEYRKPHLAMVRESSILKHWATDRGST